MAGDDSRVSVLLVDDDEFVLRMLSAVFKRRGIQVGTATSGEQALGQIEGSPPELIIADVMMPGMTGYELCRRVRALGHDDIPFIFCSALGELADRVSGLKAGADDYITKPVNIEELVLRVSSHLERIRHIRRLRQVSSPATAPPAAEVMSGQIGGLGVSDILQVAALLRKGPLQVRLERGHEQGAVYLDRGRVTHSECGADSGRRAFLRLLEWQQGMFRIHERELGRDPSMDVTIDEAVLEGLAELDELRALRDSVPGPRLRVRRRREVVQHGFDERSAELLSLVELDGRVEALLNASPLNELETLRILAGLVGAGFVAGEDDPGLMA